MADSVSVMYRPIPIAGYIAKIARQRKGDYGVKKKKRTPEIYLKFLFLH